MRTYSVLTIVGLMLWIAPNSASAVILTFDNISNHLEFELSEMYGGFTWEKVNVRNKRYSPLSTFNSNAHSGEYIAYNYFGETSLIRREGLFDFYGAYFAGAWGDIEVFVSGATADGTILTTDLPISVSKNELEWAEINFFGITSLTISSRSKTGKPYHNHFIMDNLYYEETPISSGDNGGPTINPTPEPASILLVSSGILAFLLIRCIFFRRDKNLRLVERQTFYVYRL